MAIEAQAIRYFRVRGIKNNPRYGQALREAAKFGRPGTLALVPEPSNRYDKHAIKVMLRRGARLFHVGYVPREVAALVQGQATRIRVRGWEVLYFRGRPSGIEVRYEL